MQRLLGNASPTLPLPRIGVAKKRPDTQYPLQPTLFSPDFIPYKQSMCGAHDTHASLEMRDGICWGIHSLDVRPGHTRQSNGGRKGGFSQWALDLGKGHRSGLRMVRA